MRRAIDEANGQVALELGERARQRRLGDVHALGSAGDVAFVGDLQEAAQVTKLDGHTFGA